VRTEFAATCCQWSGGCLRERYDAELLMCQLTKMGVMKHSDSINLFIGSGNGRGDLSKLFDSQSLAFV